jgi:hypothetical protein
MTAIPIERMLGNLKGIYAAQIDIDGDDRTDFNFIS